MLDRRTFLRHGLVGAGALAIGPRLGGTVLPATQLAASTAAVSAPRIITREEWGADESIRNGERFFHTLTKAVVHHTAIDEVDPAAQVRGIYRSHVQTNGWSDIGYQFLIDRSGRIYEGRWARDYLPTEPHSGEDLGGRIVEGAHAESHNRGTLGIALLGTYSSPTAPPTDAAMSSLAHLIAWKFGPRNIDPHGSAAYHRSNGEVEHFPNICGHRDIVQTGCPGDGLYPRLPWLRAAVADLLSSGLVGYRILGADGSLWNYGATTTFAAANDIGDVRRNVRSGVPVRTAAGTASGRGVWVSDTGGSIYAFGDAPFHGSLGGQRLNKPIVGMAATPSGGGYWLVASDGGIFCFGDARFFGSTGAIRLNQPIVGMAATPSGNGYWLVASDGGIFCFGDAPFHGSTGAIRLNQPIMSMSPTLDGGGYWLVARDGGVFTFGNAAFLGSAVGRGGFTGPATFMSPVPGRNGYWILDSAGAVHGFGDAPVFGGGVSTGSRPALALVPVVHS